MTACPRCERDREEVEMERRHCRADGKHAVKLVCPSCGYEVIEPRPGRDVRVSEGQRRLTV